MCECCILPADDSKRSDITIDKSQVVDRVGFKKIEEHRGICDCFRDIDEEILEEKENE